MRKRAGALKTKTVIINAGVQLEHLLETPINLTTTYPETPQLSITITADSMPNILGAQDIGVGLGVFISLYGYAGTAAYSGVFYTIYKNGVAVASDVSFSTTSGSRQYNRVILAKTAVVAGDVITVKLRAANETTLTVHGCRMAVMPWGYFGKPNKKRLMFVQSFKYLESGVMFSGTIGRTTLIGTTTYSLKQLRLGGANKTYEYESYGGDCIYYEGSNSLNKYIAGGLGTDYRDTDRPYILYDQADMLEYVNSTTNDITTTLFLARQLYPKKMLIKYREI